MLQKALEKAKKGDDKKVSINFQVPSLMKEEFEKICKENGVSITGMLNSLIEITIEEHYGVDIVHQDTFKLIEELDDAKRELSEIERALQDGHKSIMTTGGVEVDLEFEHQVALAKINAFVAEIEKKGKK